jgi:hypothetical protein
MTIDSNPATRAGFPAIRSGISLPRRFSRPRGVLTFSPERPAITSSTPIPIASIRAGSTRTLTSRREAPTRLTFPTPGMFSRRRFTFRSTSVVRSRGVSVPERTASATTGIAPKSIFWITGSLICSGSSRRTPLILARTSCDASLIRTWSWNSTMTDERLSREVE